MANILIVDDSRTSRMIMRGILENGGHKVVGEAVNGKEAFDLYIKLKPDIVTMDITMPIMDGIDALKMIIRNDPKARIIMVTSSGQEKKVIEAVNSGAIEFITKPFDPQMLLDKISKNLM